MECSAYEHRDQLFDKVTAIAPQFANLNPHDQFIFLMTQGDNQLWREIAQVVHNWMMKRLDIRKQEQEIEFLMATQVIS